MVVRINPVPRQKAIGVNLERHTLTPGRECYPAASASSREFAESRIRFGSDPRLHHRGHYGQDMKSLKNPRVSGGPRIKQRAVRSDDGALQLTEAPRRFPSLAGEPLEKEERLC